MNLDKFVAKTLVLLEKERDAEIEETRYLHEKLPPKELERKGVCLLKLQVANHASGLYGRTVVTFEPFWMKKELPPHNMNPGDIVQLSLNQSNPDQKEGLATGLISKVTPSSIAVAFDESQNLETLDSDVQYKLLKVANDVTYQRLKQALTNLHKAERGASCHLVNVLFGEEDLYPPEDPRDLKFFNTNLNECQQKAVEFALFQRDVAIIHGPPGTGKTTTVVEIIMQAVKQKQKVLACAPSNIAVDNLVERLVNQKQKVVRIGHPSRLLPHLQKYCLDAILTSSSAGKLVLDVKKDMDKACSQLIKCKHRGEKFKYQEEMKFLRKELRQRMSLATKEVLENADVVLVTLTSASNDGALRQLKEEHFDLVVIDECSQAIEAACWMALPRARKCVIAGDHCQLPPTILSQEAAKEGLEETLMERILKLYGDRIKKMLVTQYRMNHLIMQWSSDQLYQGQLVADPSVEHHLLRDMSGIEDGELTSDPLLLIDTAGCNLCEMDVPEEISKGNQGEADIVNHHVRQLISCGLSVDEIAVIAPYNLQVELLRLRLSSDFPKLEIKSVDGFQGREKEAVVISMVRSNKKGEVGFLAENRRINVAITRAKRHLAVICDSETVGHNEFLRSLMDYMSEKGIVQTAHQYVQDGITGAIMSDKKELMNEIEKHNKKKKSEKKSADKNQKSKQLSKKEHDEKRQKELHQILTDFANNPNERTKEFPPTLNSFERMLVHEIAAKFGLTHISVGEGDERHIVISKSKGENCAESESSQTEKLVDAINTLDIRMENDDVTKDCPDSNGFALSEDLQASQESVEEGAAAAASSAPSVEEDVAAASSAPSSRPKQKKYTKTQNKPLHLEGFDSPDEEKEKCPHCLRDILKTNIHLHTVHCSRRVAAAQKALLTPQPQTQHSKSKNKSKKTDKMVKALTDIDADDFDGLINAAMDVNSKCGFSKCKQKTQIMGVDCQFCRLRFCFSHSLPEVHGCGHEAKVHARATLVKEGVVYRGSGVPSKLPNATKKAQLQKKLDKKLTNLADQRKAKPKKS